MSDDPDIPMPKNKGEWLLIWRVAIIILSGIAAAAGAAILFAGKAYVRESAAAEVQTLTSEMKGFPARVIVLEEARTRQDKDQRTTNNSVNLIQQDVASIKATQIESEKNNERNTERILNRLDSLATHH